MPNDTSAKTQKALSDLNSANNSDSGTAISTLPDEKNVPDGGTLPTRYGKIINLAAGKDASGVCARFRAWAYTNIRRFEGQDQRESFVENGGVMDIADRMLRVSLNQDTTNTQNQNTKSDVTSPMFLVQERAITAGEMAIFFGDTMKLPAEYEPEINTSEYTTDDGKHIAQHQNALQQLTFDEDGRKEKIREILHWTNAYGNQVVTHDWIRETRDVTENVPDEAKGVNENGSFRAFKRVTKNRVVKDWPTISLIPIENCYFDALIPELKNQMCFAYKDRMGYGELLSLYKDGYIDNLGQVTAGHLYKGEQEQDSPIEQRMENAGENGTTEETGEVEIWRVWGRVPIDERTTPKTRKVRADWDGAKHAPGIYFGMFAGRISSGNAVCLKLCKNPHWHGEIPATLLHSHQDNKGAFHKGDAEMLQSLYAQACTNINQAVDNVTKRINAPMTANGPVHTRDLTYRQNKLIQLDRSTEFKVLDVPDTTRITLEMQAFVEEQANRLTGADKPLRGEALGSRTSATEATNVHDQSMQPLSERASYIAEQLFQWMFRLDAEAWRQYGSPNTALRITHNDVVLDVNPGELWGPIRTKVTSVDRFKNTTSERQTRNLFLQNVLPMFLQSMTPEGIKALGRQTFRQFGFDNIDILFPASGDYDAEARAQTALQSMLVTGEFVEPQPEENHSAWIPVLERAAAQYKLLPEGEFDPARHQMLLFNIQQRRDMKAQQEAALQAQAAGAAGGAGGGAGGQEGTVGELAANPAEAEAGALAQA